MEFLMRASKKDAKTQIAGLWWSEKLNGFRCYWDGGVSRGDHTDNVPWANPKCKEIATGLWSKYGNVYHAPDWFLNKLPATPLDGELYNNKREGGGERQDVASCVKKKIPVDAEWEKIHYYPYDIPGDGAVFSNRKITGTFFERQISNEECFSYLRSKNADFTKRPHYFIYEAAYKQLSTDPIFDTGVLSYIRQNPLPSSATAAALALEEAFAKVIQDKGEGLMLRNPMLAWTAKKVKGLIKVKPGYDDEAVIIGTTPGLGQFAGMVGAVIVKWKDKVFSINVARPEDRDPSVMKEGKRITFSYANVTRNGIPQEARIVYREDVGE